MSVRRLSLTVPEMFFVVGTRAALAVGLALLISGRMTVSTRRAVGVVLLGIGGLTSIPAAKLLIGQRSLLSRLGLPD